MEIFLMPPGKNIVTLYTWWSVHSDLSTHCVVFLLNCREPSPGSSPAPDSGPPPAVYADPNTIQREEFPGTQDVYTVPDKKKKKHKPEDHLPTYQVVMNVV